MPDKLVNYRGDGGIAILTLNDPPANTYTHQMMRDLDEAILQARFDDNVLYPHHDDLTKQVAHCKRSFARALHKLPIG